ncbi:MAG: PstS family phosphate ABC transporter substrate-binding protein [Deltaproteobacteria bacterium]|nr:PstS family phosphate ABC transporter substrate-binding protein [Deltaproteobacteria bacterium]
MTSFVGERLRARAARFGGFSTVCAAVSLIGALGCGRGPTGEGGSSGAVITIDGSSTVYPISEAVAEEFQSKNAGSRVTVGRSGTGGGFQKLCRGEIAIAGASRPITAAEIEACRRANVEWIELPVAYDGLAVVVNPQNTWATSITVAELKRMWEPEAQARVMRWSQVREGWPDEPLRLFGAGVDSGTYDYFTKAIVGREHASRGDYTSSEDDNVLVQGIAGDRLAIGFFGLAYYEENRSRLRVVPVDDGDASNGAGPITPSQDTVSRGTYQPLARPIFVYVRKAALASDAALARFVEFYVQNAGRLAPETGYVPLPARAYELAAARLRARTTGSLFSGGSQIGVTIEQLLAREAR